MIEGLALHCQFISSRPLHDWRIGTTTVSSSDPGHHMTAGLDHCQFVRSRPPHDCRIGTTTVSSSAQAKAFPMMKNNQEWTASVKLNDQESIMLDYLVQFTQWTCYPIAEKSPNGVSCSYTTKYSILKKNIPTYFWNTHTQKKRLRGNFSCFMGRIERK